MRGNILFKILDKYIGIFFVFYLGIFSKIFNKQKEKSEKDIKNILVVKLSALGDTILLFPVIKALKKRYENAQTIVVCTEINHAIWKKMSYVDKIYCLDIKRLVDPNYVFRFFLNLRKHNFDLAIDFDQWLRISAILTMISKSSERIGFNTPGQYKHFGFTKKVRHSKNIHELDCFIRFLEILNTEVKDRSLNFSVSSKSLETAEGILKNCGIYGKRFIVVHPGCGTHGWQREWHPQKYSQICNWLIKEFGYNIVLTGSKNERKVVDLVVNGIKEKVINLQGKLDIEELAALFKKSGILISGNTGIMHLAAAVGARCIALHGPTNYFKWGPLGKGHIIINSPVSCSPCLNLGFEYGCNERKCMEAISVEEVKSKMERVING